ncbi:hypothetical protein HYV81_04485 [Candidatus Woesearchaeota archaeon]|nr:hypothetical protein [Candidatus Woesearchaeota archaeon]
MQIDNIDRLVLGLLVAGMFIAGFNEFQLMGMGSMNAPSNTIQGQAIMQQGVQAQPAKENLPDIFPKGMPRIYGAELSVSYDDISLQDQKKADGTIAKLGRLDTGIRLSGEEKERYISIASQISCEYCCGTDSIIFQNGEAACGCQHSFAMRGVAKYLIRNHGSEFTDDEILEELGKWKTLFFPDIMAEKAAVMQKKGIELNYINIASNKYRGIEN